MDNTLKLHYSTEEAIQYRYRKVKSVVAALNITLQEQPKETFIDLKELSPIPTLPILETDHGNFTSSNTIIRYLAATKDYQLYGGDNEYNRALIDQWLDITTCDFDTCVLAANLHADCKEVSVEALTQDVQKFLGFVNKHLKNRKFLVGEELSIADLAVASAVGPVLSLMFGENERKKYNLLVTWYLAIAKDHKDIEPKAFGNKAHKRFEKKDDKADKKDNKADKQGNKQGNKQGKGKKDDKKDEKKNEKKKKDQKKEEAGKKEQTGNKQEADKKEETKEAEKKEQEDDLFGDDNPAAPAAPPVKPPAKKEKAKAVAKSIVVFDVKVYEQEQDLEALFQKIKSEIVVDGLVWNEKPKIMPVAFGMNKLQIGCVIEDAKVSLEEHVFEKILEWEDEVQSVDTVSFQKL